MKDYLSWFSYLVRACRNKNDGVSNQLFIPCVVRVEKYMKKIMLSIVVIFSIFVSFEYGLSKENVVQEISPTVPDRLKKQLETFNGSYGTEVASIYSERKYSPIWIEDYDLNESGEQLIQTLSDAVQQGLDPQDYEADEIQWLLRTIRLFSVDDHIARTEMLWKLETVLTKNFFKFADHLTAGRISPEAVNGKWYLTDHRHSLTSLMSDALERGVSATFTKIASGHDGYTPLFKALASYRTIQTQHGWPIISDGPLLGSGSHGERVRALRRRLSATKDLKSDPDNNVFNKEVVEAVRRFQQRHGLTVDGLLGPVTLKELNVPVEARIKQILINLERRRWMPRGLGKDYVYVNIPDYMLTAFLDGKEGMRMRVIVGKPMSQTPIFSDTIEYVVFNPYWYVPRSIATEEIFPKFREDPLYLQTKNYELVDWDEQVLESDLFTLENLENNIVRLRQRPGPSNALGLVKFMFPNDHAIYLHDTPADYLFDESERDFSHGCIRIEDPRAFAEFLLGETYTPEKITEIYKTQKREVVDMSQTVPVYIVYFTSWVDNDGLINFREDIYGHDERLWQALKPALSNTLARPHITDKWIYGLSDKRASEIPHYYAAKH